MTSSTPPSIDARASRVLSLASASAIGAIPTIGLLVYLLLGPLFGLTGSNTPAAYLLWGFFSIPVVLALGERALASGEQGGLLALAQARKRIQLSFFLGWLMVGGLVSLGATLAVGAGSHLALVVGYFTDFGFPAEWLSIAILVLVLLNQWARAQASWSRRATLLGLSLVLLLALLAWAQIRPLGDWKGYAYMPAGPSILGTAWLASGFWGLHFILESRQHMRQRGGYVLAALAAALLVAALSGAAAAGTLSDYPKLVLGNQTPLIDLAIAAGPIPEVVALATVLVISMLALDQVVSSTLRAAAEMAASGFFPSSAAPSVPARTSGRSLLLLSIAFGLAAAFLPLGVLAAGASFAILICLGILLMPASLRRAGPAAPGELRLPLYPLLPLTAVVVCAAMVLALPPPGLLPIGCWFGLGVLYYFVRGRRAAIGLRQRLEVVQEERSPNATEEGYRILVAIANPDTAGSLLRAGRSIARSRSGSVIALRVLETSPQASNEERSWQARQAWDELHRWIDEAKLGPDGEVQTMVRQAPSVLEGLQATIWEESVDTLLLGWPVPRAPRLIEQDNIVDRIVRAASCEVFVLRGELPARASRVLIPLTSDDHAPAALELGRVLHPESILALKPIRDPISVQRRSAMLAAIREELDRHDLPPDVDSRVVHAPEATQAVLEAAADCDLTILGVSEEGFLAVTAVLGMPRAVMEGSTGPVLLVKRREVAPQFWLRRGWEQLSSSLPNLTGDQQRAVGLSLRQDARAGIDFYVLIILSASLAFLGLLQNSSAVIIGAMLVAPLMSPILAMAHGIVRGDIREIRQAADSTLNGVILAIMLPAFLSLLLLGIGQGLKLDATPEILARTQPALLDLLVAFISGLAAAYAISRAEVAAALPGVAIAAALVPPLAVAGYGLGTAQFLVATGALLLFLTNLVSIVLAGTTMLLLLGIRPPVRAERGERTREALRWALVGIVAVSVPLLVSTVGQYRRASQQASVEAIVAGWWLPGEAEVVDIGFTTSRRETRVHLTVYDLSGRTAAEGMDGLQAALSAKLGVPVTLDYVVIPASAGVSAPRTPTPTASPTPTATPRPSATPRPTATPPP